MKPVAIVVDNNQPGSHTIIDVFDNKTLDIAEELFTRKQIKSFNHHSNILLIEEVIRDLEGKKKTDKILAHEVRDPAEEAGYNHALDDTISSLTKSLEEIRNLLPSPQR